MIKILGSILILFASIYACIAYEKREKSKLSALNTTIEFIKHIKAQIEYFSTPINKIFATYEHSSEVTKKLAKKDINDSQSDFDKESFKVVSNFFSSLGRGVKSEQLSLCTYTINELEKISEKNMADYPNKIKVFRAMALFCGICAIILLI